MNVLFSGTSNEGLATEIGAHPNKIRLERFPDGEISVEILEDVNGKDAFVVQSLAPKPNEHLIELLLIVDALKRSSARSITAVIPYLGYCRQDRMGKKQVPISARLIANLLETAGVTKVITMDLHSDQIEGFFNIPVKNLTARQELAKAIKKLQLDDVVVVGPDIGSVKYAASFAKELGCEFCIIDKQRINHNNVVVRNIVGNVEGKTVILTDDICSTGHTLIAAAQKCIDCGAKKVLAAVTHYLAHGDLENSPIEHIFVTNTIQKNRDCSKLSVVSVAKIFANEISF